ncbi:MAG: DUF1501 domain-containing protein [Gemmataceae bacterium]
MRRRDFLLRAGGLGMVAARWLDAGAATHHPPKARRVIQLFMNGGASQCDLFDHKPALIKKAGQKFDPGEGFRVEAATSVPGKVVAPPVPLRQRGESGRWVSDLLPHLAKHVDDLAFLMALKSRTNVHGPASYLMNTGFLLPGFPCLGAWVSYALGRITDDLPTFVVLPDPRGLPYNGQGNFSSGFLPVTHQGTVISGSRIPFLEVPKGSSPGAERDGLALLGGLNRAHAGRDAEDTRLSGRVEAYELAARMQLAAPEAFDLGRETRAVQRLYGVGEPATDDFGRRCLTARRLVERGVRFVQVWSGAGGSSNNWDNHGSMSKELPPMCASTDRPIAGLLTDLKARGLLDDTLVLWSTEFGRMPFAQGGDGRDHNGGTSVGWMAGAGVKGGVAHGESDEWSWRAEKDAATNYDLHATVLHLLGLDHERLAVRDGGADRRLTDVHGHVIRAVLR